jgi:hypothetical protein
MLELSHPRQPAFGAYSSDMNATLQYLTNEKGRKTAVVLPLSEYERLLEDLDDLRVIAERRGEPTIPHGQFKRQMRRHGLSR